MQEKDTLHFDMERLLGTTTALLKQDSIRSSTLPAPYSPRLSRANSETNSVVSSASKRPLSGSPLFSASRRVGTPSETESLQLDRASPRALERMPSLSLRASRETGVTFDTKGLKAPKQGSPVGTQDSPFDTPRSYQTSTLFGGRPATGERRSSSPGNLARPRTLDMPSTSSPSFMHQSSSPQLAARPSTTGSIAARPTSPPGHGRKISFSSPAPPASQVVPRARTLSSQPSSRSLSPFGTDSKRHASLSPLPSAEPARPSSSGLQSPRLLSASRRGIRPSPSSTSIASRLGPSISPRPNDQAGSPRGIGSLSMRTRAQDEELRPPELIEWQAVAKEAKSMLDHGQEEREDAEQRIASLRAKVQGWEGLLDEVVQKFDKSVANAFQEIFSRARTRVKIHEDKSAPSMPGCNLPTGKASTYQHMSSKGPPLTVDVLQTQPSSGPNSLAHSSSSSIHDATSQHRTAMPTPQPHLKSTTAFNPFEAAAASTFAGQPHMPASTFAGQPHPMMPASTYSSEPQMPASTITGQPYPMSSPAAPVVSPHLQSHAQHASISEQPPLQQMAYQAMRQQQLMPSESQGFKDHAVSAQGLGSQSSPFYAQPPLGPTAKSQHNYAQPRPGPTNGVKSSFSYPRSAPEGPISSSAYPSTSEAQQKSSQRRDRPSSHPPHRHPSAQTGHALPRHVAPAPPQLASAAAACLWQEFANSRAYCPYKNPGEWVALRM